MKSIRIAISPCLIGRPIRYDGTDRRSPHVMKLLEAHRVELIPTCPEFAIGLGVPRPKIQHEIEENGEVRLIMPDRNRLDLTERMIEFVRNRVEALMELNIHGYILKARSPSCGIDDVEVHCANGQIQRNGTGFLTRAILQQMPNLPMIDELKFLDTKIRDRWWARVIAQVGQASAATG
ncbi:MAG: 2-thiouracil desulfurase family protein [Planctomycetia bacterium]|jgi:uncharacterized protein YbbK (DUF523 family)